MNPIPPAARHTRDDDTVYAIESFVLAAAAPSGARRLNRDSRREVPFRETSLVPRDRTATFGEKRFLLPLCIDAKRIMYMETHRHGHHRHLEITERNSGRCVRECGIEEW